MEISFCLFGQGLVYQCVTSQLCFQCLEIFTTFVNLWLFAGNFYLFLDNSKSELRSP